MADLAEPNIVRAAGGILVRGGPDPRTTTTVVIHRPRHDDWSFPKGKLDPGETAEEAALREVYEETAVRCELVLPLGVVRYPLAAGAVKHTEYWIMRVTLREARSCPTRPAACHVAPLVRSFFSTRSTSRQPRLAR